MIRIYYANDEEIGSVNFKMCPYHPLNIGQKLNFISCINKNVKNHKYEVIDVETEISVNGYNVIETVERVYLSLI